MKKTFGIVFAFILGIVFIYLTYTILNILVTLIREKKKDKTLIFCFSLKGKIFYIVITVLYFVMIGLGTYMFISGLKNNDVPVWLNGIVLPTLYTLLFSMQLANIVLIGKKHMMVGRLAIDYRKMKKVDFNYHNEMTFVFSQHNYKFSTRWLDIPILRRAITRRS